MSGVAGFLAGGVAMAYSIVGIFFMRFWVRARDPLFLSFGIAFFLLALNQTLVGIFGGGTENHAELYLLRLIAFLLIILAIVRKNIRE